LIATKIKKKMKPIVFALLISGCPMYFIVAQTVSFTENSPKLPFIMGTMGQAKCAADMNGDMLDDITRIGSEGIHIDYQQPDGSFQHRFFSMGVQALPTWSICAGDLDNNGWNDLLFGSKSRVSFLLAQANGAGFVESLMPDFIFSQRTTLSDIDLDGDLDAFVCRDDGKSQTFRNYGAGNMALDQTLLNTSNLPGNYSAIWTDYDNDGYTDLYITKCLATGMPGNPARTNLLYHNNGNGTFTEKGAAAGLDDNAQSWSTVFEDFDNDGDFDAFIVNHDQGNRLFQNNGDGTFANIIAASGIDEFDLGAWENASGDFNNDGFADIFSELANRLYLGNGDMTFTGQSLPFTPGAVGDFNNDGFLDVTYRSQLWINDGNDHHWLKLHLRGIESNRNGIGARIEIYGAWGVQVRELRAGQSFSPMNTLSVHFGLGQADSIDKLVVRWPGGTVTEILNLTADSTYFIPEAPCIRVAEDITISGKTDLCPGDSVSLTAPSGYAHYRWSNGTTAAELQTGAPGLYHVVCIDSTGCAGISKPVVLTRADAVLPEISIISGEKQMCDGAPVVLKSAAGNQSYWSNGVQDTGTITVTTSGSYTVARDSVCGAGKLVSTPIDIAFLAAPAPQTDAVTLAAGDSILLLASGENCAWYDVPTGGSILSDGCSFQTLPVFSDTVLYVESRYKYPGAIQSGGKPDSLGFGAILTSNKEMRFTAWAPFTLLTTDIYILAQASEGERTIQLISGNSILAETSAYLYKGKNVVALNFQIPVGKFSLKCDQNDQFQNIGALDYPYPVGDVGQLDSSSTGLNFYPYFFNWVIQKPEITCVSPRTPVTIEVSANKEVFERLNVEIFPVPASKTLQIVLHDTPAPDAEVLVLDIAGRYLIRQSLQQRNYLVLNTAELPSGVYQLVIIAQNRVASKTFILEN
jgi:hypothetical protein